MSSFRALMHVDLGGYHVRPDIRVHGRPSNVVEGKVGQGTSGDGGSGAEPNNTIKFRRPWPKNRHPPSQRGMTHDGLGKYLSEKVTKAKGFRTGGCHRDPQGDRHRRGRQLPPGGLRGGHPSGTRSRFLNAGLRDG